jgi:hypothetical protein
MLDERVRLSAIDLLSSPAYFVKWTFFERDSSHYDYWKKESLGEDFTKTA